MIWYYESNMAIPRDGEVNMDGSPITTEQEVVTPKVPPPTESSLQTQDAPAVIESSATEAHAPLDVPANTSTAEIPVADSAKVKGPETIGTKDNTFEQTGAKVLAVLAQQFKSQPWPIEVTQAYAAILSDKGNGIISPDTATDSMLRLAHSKASELAAGAGLRNPDAPPEQAANVVPAAPTAETTTT